MTAERSMAARAADIVFRTARPDEYELAEAIIHEAFEPYRTLTPPSGALSETAATLRAKTAGTGGCALGAVGNETVAAAIY